MSGPCGGPVALGSDNRVRPGGDPVPTLTPISDTFLPTGSRIPGGMVFWDIRVDVPRPAGDG